MGWEIRRCSWLKEAGWGDKGRPSMHGTMESGSERKLLAAKGALVHYTTVHTQAFPVHGEWERPYALFKLLSMAAATGFPELGSQTLMYPKSEATF